MCHFHGNGVRKMTSILDRLCSPSLSCLMPQGSIVVWSSSWWQWQKWRHFLPLDGGNTKLSCLKAMDMAYRVEVCKKYVNRRVEIFKVILNVIYHEQEEKYCVCSALFLLQNGYSLKGDSFRINDEPNFPFVFTSQYHSSKCLWIVIFWYSTSYGAICYYITNLSSLPIRVSFKNIFFHCFKCILEKSQSSN